MFYRLQSGPLGLEPHPATRKMLLNLNPKREGFMCVLSTLRKAQKKILQINYFLNNFEICLVFKSYLLFFFLFRAATAASRLLLGTKYPPEI